MKKIGAHLSISGGYTKALERIVDIGGNCLQIFSSSPRSWGIPAVQDSEAENFKNIKIRLKINPVYFHAPYLINLAVDNHVGIASIKELIKELTLAAKLGVKGSVIHLGSYKNNTEEIIPDEIMSKSYNTLIKNIKEILANTPSNTLFIIENSATSKIGQSLDEIAKLIKDLDDKRVKVCFDTCHLHAAGYNLSTQENLNQFLNIFNSFIGLDRLELWHVNDSKDPFNSRRDRHENIGSGHVGTEVFRLLLNHPQTKDLPFIIETPGFNQKGPDKENLDILKSFIEETQPVAPEASSPTVSL